MRRSDVQDEPSIANRFLTKLETRINEFGTQTLGISGLQIQCKILTDRGPGSQESKFGADFAVLLDISVPNFVLRKGFLCQAKKEGDGINIVDSSSIRFTSSGKRIELREQVKKMLNISQATYVIILGSNGFWMLPGSSVYGLTENDSVYSKSISDFFKEFLMCFIGDMKLSTDHKDWDKIRESVDKVLKITIEQKGDKNQEKNDEEIPPDFLLNNITRQMQMKIMEVKR